MLKGFNTMPSTTTHLFNSEEGEGGVGETNKGNVQVTTGLRVVVVAEDEDGGGGNKDKDDDEAELLLGLRLRLSLIGPAA